ncbi:MAG: efflux RND transporter periplasmic adaptor subunit [Planctomycetes bacterium]|nr:efflux RND transporter periplasmic adaptor subunit [Planctomycetota bacterium]
MKTVSIICAGFVLGTCLSAADPDHDGHDRAVVADSPTVQLGVDGARRLGVEVGAARRHRASQSVRAPAWVSYDPDATAHVGTVVAGRISQVLVKLGDTVRAGDPLLVIDSAELGRAQSDFFQALATADAAVSAAELARQASERAKGLEQVIAPAERQRREADLKRAAGAAAAAKATAQSARNGLVLMGMEASAIDALASSGTVSPRMTITAPIDGMVIARDVAMGRIASPDQESLVTIVDPGQVWVVAHVPEGSSGAIRAGDAAVVTSPLIGSPIASTVAWVSATVDADTRSVPVRVVVPAATGLKPGAFAQVEIRPAAAQGQAPIAVPSEAVFSMDSMPTVFVPGTTPGSFLPRVVEVGPASDGLVPILKGLAEGDAVVVRGGFILKAELGKAGSKGCCDP